MTTMTTTTRRRRRDDCKWILSIAATVLGVSIVVAVATSLVRQAEPPADPGAASRLLLTAAANPVFRETHAPFFPLSTSDYWGLFATILGLLVAAGGGIGGGGILVPINILIFGFSPKHAIPLSNVTVLAGALANSAVFVWKRHPHTDRPLIDWDLILAMEPLTIAGAHVGAYLNKILPEVLLTLLLVLLLSLTAYTSLEKAVQLYRAETAVMRSSQSELTLLAQKQQLQDDDDDDDDDEQETVEEDTSESLKTALIPVALDEPAPRTREQEQLLAAFMERERQTFPVENIRILLTLFIVVLVVNIFKGGGAFPSPLGITCGSTTFWMVNAFILVWIAGVAVHARHYLLEKNRLKHKCGYVHVPGDIEWDDTTTVKYPLLCCLAGLCAGMFGIGGGIVKGPLMLAMGVHPAVGSASSACMILFTSFTATTSFMVFGLMVPDYAVVLFIVGFFATLVGQGGLAYLIKKAGRNSYIAFSIGAVVLISAFLMTIQSLLSVAEGEKHHSGGVCGKGD
jgi:uncharacterized membrane protein YfcA